MVELQLLAPQDRVEAVGDALIDDAIGALSVSIEDADADTPGEDALFGEPGMPAPRAGWRRSLIRALFADDTAATGAATLLLAQPFAGGVRLQAIAPVPDEDWVRLTQSQFAPVPITPDFWIVPSWHEPPREAAHVIRLDPGLAFGTGTHPTTRMCLRWTAQQRAERRARWKRVLDYGCGSGILAIGAALHGAQAIDAVDIDPAAVEATRANALANGVTLAAGLPEAASGAYDLVFANILATPLTLLAPLLCAHVAAGGDLVLAGILERQADALTAAYAPWLNVRVADTEDGWILMTARAS
ncbi:MAG TPA: 50S ribosomal protein L11 methyltransferase [Burkholderiaceae bacterium]|nr:50S ribosomal protein L11 methyltransferase [Burkholderiaceae bacterium]